MTAHQLKTAPPPAAPAATAEEKPLPETMERRLRSLAELEKGWDGHGAAPAERAAVEHARLFLLDLQRGEDLAPGTLSFSLLPGSEGEVDLNWEHPERGCDFYVWITPEGNIGWGGRTPNIAAADLSADPSVPYEPGMELPAELLRFLRDIPPA